MTDLQSLIAKAQAAYEALSPEAKARDGYEQRRSFVRGMCPSKTNYDDWCKRVDELLPPVAQSVATVLKRYLVFAGADYYPGGGWDDFVDSSDSLDGAKAIANSKASDVFNWAHIVDSQTGGKVE